MMNTARTLSATAVRVDETSRPASSETKRRPPRRSVVLLEELLAAVLLLLVFAPPLLLAGMTIVSLALGVQALVVATQLVSTYRFDALETQLGPLDAASRLAVLGVSFFTAICALVVFLAGVFGRGRRHLFLIPGVLLAAPSLLAFVQGSHLAATLLTRADVPLAAQVAILCYLLLDMLVLSLLLTDTRPPIPAGRVRRMRYRRVRHTRPPALTYSAVPVVRFAPPNYRPEDDWQADLPVAYEPTVQLPAAVPAPAAEPSAPEPLASETPATLDSAVEEAETAALPAIERAGNPRPADGER